MEENKKPRRKKRPCATIDMNCYSWAFLQALRKVHELAGNHKAVPKESALELIDDNLKKLRARTDDDGAIQTLVNKLVISVTKNGLYSVARKYW